MPHLHRFYLPAELAAGARLTLEGEEAHHALHVVRVKVGETLALINGRGAEALARVEACSRREVSLVCEFCEVIAPERRQLTLLQAALHNPKAMEFVVRHGTEIGATRFVIFRAEHSERVRGGLEKLERTAIEAMKQCGRRWLPEIEAVDGIEAALACAQGQILIASMDAPPLPLGEHLDEDAVSLLVGPEGDFSAGETATAIAAGAKPFSLGQYTYRSEVATLLAATIVQHGRGLLGPV